MSKLELFELAGYAAYGLKVADDSDNIATIAALYEDCCHVRYDVNVGDYELGFDEIRPLVTPLSKLTESEWVQVFGTGNREEKPELINLHDRAILRYKKGECVYYFEHCLFSTAWEFPHDNGQMFNQLAAFQELYKLHADIHGLIERGIGLDKTMVK